MKKESPEWKRCLLAMLCPFDPTAASYLLGSMVFMDPLKRVQALPQGIQTWFACHQWCKLYITQYLLKESSSDSGTRRTLLPHLHVCSHAVAQSRVNRGAGGCFEGQTDTVGQQLVTQLVLTTWIYFLKTLWESGILRVSQQACQPKGVL